MAQLYTKKADRTAGCAYHAEVDASLTDEVVVETHSHICNRSQCIGSIVLVANECLLLASDIWHFWSLTRMVTTLMESQIQLCGLFIYIEFFFDYFSPERSGPEPETMVSNHRDNSIR